MKFSKNLFVRLLITLFLFGSSSVFAQLISHWKGEGNAQDSVGSNHGMAFGDTTFAPGQVGQAFSLDGTGDYVEIPDNSTLDLTTFVSISAWINPQSTDSNRIVDKITAGSGDGYLLDLLAGKLRFIVGNVVVSSSSDVALNTFSHVAGVYDGTNMKVYINGNLEGTLPVGTPLAPNNLSLRIGADSNAQNGFVGLIDEVKIFDVPLDENEVISGGSPVTVPTLNEWGVIILILCLSCAAFMRIRKVSLT